ncbi:type-F conjugative transfer system secretin TraK [Photobacterium damselae]|uniref:IncF plasmid conjugative transfer pilus assembly protein TraK n=1 Tax=Photobacterium damselae subsp. damselae TaxID=85581 RepID=E4WL69_PHODD|nr:type-F conjugative transfer system secretin TraK [Photobacterium damselae]KAB1176918.1 type-F conjugative transfer system secretin TraK [Photobacterium damselae subsp. damselae]NVO72848.1 type-F conjugative transfer system secretin TraK [Photobacterium damselae subsp. damselae]QSH59558.1 type-F conjugative transfer system secretin TraK [Photobacterium damselae subsp. damselae]CBX86787.1 IncF plasmid conjugative transfer pilus assembly protein TraK [Photobacterium damselae subsp. damselae]SP
MKSLLLLAALLPAVAVAAPPTTIPFSNNETITLNLSSMDINRLVVQDDKITSVTCPTGFCTLPISKEGAGVDPQGAALITIDVLEPFTLYVTTQKGRSFGAFVRPLAVPAVTTLLVSTDRDTEQAAKFEHQSPYSETLARLIRHMVTDTQPDGFLKQSVTSKPSPFGLFSLQALHSYQGESLTGVVYHLKNPTTQAVTIEPDSFYQKGVYAVAFSANRIPPGGSIYLYQITGR